MGDHQDGAGIFLEMVFKPLDTFGIEVVGRLIEQQNVGLCDQQAGEGNAAFFTAGQAFHAAIGWRAAQGLHRDFELVVERPAVHRVNRCLKLCHLVAQCFKVCVRLCHLCGRWR